jgi:hypothetical protein
MNDLDVVRALRADAPNPSGDRLAEGRARLSTAMAASALGRRTERVHHAQRTPLVPRGPRAVAGVITAVGVAAAVALATVVLLPAGGGRVVPVARPVIPRDQSIASAASAGPTGPAARLLSVTAVLNDAAAAAARRPATLPGPHQWIYDKGVKAGPVSRFTREGWITFDGARTADIESGRLVVLPYGPGQDGVSAATPQGAASFLRSLPAKPKALLAVIYRKAEATPRDEWAAPGDLDTEAFSILMTYLYNAPVGVPSSVQADVFRAVAWIPGVDVTKARDALGRPALALSAAGLNGYFLLDPRSYALIGLRDGTAAVTRIAARLVPAPGDR